MDRLIIDQGDRPHLPEVQAAIDELRRRSRGSWRYKATVSGSFRRHLSEVQAAMDELDQHRVRVLSPGSTVSIGEEYGFTFLATDPSRDMWETEQSHLEAIAKSDFLWVACPDGEVGDSTALEIGYAVAKRKPIFCLHQPVDQYDGILDIRELVTVVKSVAEALLLVERMSFLGSLFLASQLPGFRAA